MKEEIAFILYRILNNKIYLFMATLVTPVVIFVAVFFTNKIETKSTIGIIGDIEISIKNVNAIYLEEEPKFSELVQGKYDAIVKKENEIIQIETIRGENFKNSLEDALRENASYVVTSDRGIVTNLIGFITMFILVFASMLFKFYYDEKTGINKRVLSTSINHLQYSISHFLVVFAILFVPTIIIILLGNIILQYNENVSYIHILFMVFTLCLFATSFSFFISSCIKTEANGGLVATMIIVITTLIAGSFFEVAQNGFTSFINKFLPQRYLLDYAIALENGLSPNHFSILGIILISIVLFILGTQINQKIVE